MIFDGPNGLRYDTTIHDFIEEDGTMASAERVAEAWGTSIEDVEEDRRARADRQPGQEQA